MKFIGEYPSISMFGISSKLYQIETPDIGTYLPDLIAYRTPLRIPAHYVGKYAEITLYEDGYEDSRILTREYAETILRINGMSFSD